MSGIPKQVRAAVLNRAEGICEWCGMHLDVELHHRRFRSRGGKHTVQNIVAVCGWGNHTGCHGKAHTTPTEAARGFAVSQYDRRDESQIPIRLARWGWVTLNPDGSITMHARKEESSGLVQS